MYNKFMKRLILSFLAIGLALVGPAPVGAVDVNNFVVRSYQVDMTLGRDADRRSTLDVVETVVAVFPDFDQNHGFERVLVDRYDGHKTSLKLRAVEDQTGRPLEYSFEDGVLRIGNKDTYVHGERTYVIKYSQRDVTRYFEDVGRDEFYWDVVGLDMRIVRENVKVQLSIDPSIKSAATGDTACYVGASGSTNRCGLVAMESGFVTGADRLEPLEGMTLAIGFSAGTFAPYQETLLEKIMNIWLIVQAAVASLGLAALIWFLVRWHQITRRAKEKSTIVPEYLPPADTSVTAAARVASVSRSVMTAQMLDLAVRHYIKIYETVPKKLMKAAEYEIEIIKDIDDLKWEEKELLKDTFGGMPSVGQRLNLKTLQNSTSYYTRTLNNNRDLDKLIRGKYGFMAENIKLKQRVKTVATGLLVAGVLLLSPVLLVGALICFGMSFASWTLTDKGLALVRYLDGLKMYIKVAEVDRIKMLQSPEGATKVASVAQGVEGPQLIKLYERVLPYAVLYGLEKQWNQQLGTYYETTGAQPDWYVGQSAFNAAAFSTAMSDFSTVNNYASSVSSSSGGSGGGGFSGGGGGGGGGGGW